MTDLSHWAHGGVRPRFTASRHGFSFGIRFRVSGWLRPLLGLLIPGLLAAVWWWTAAARLVPAEILPPPWTVARAFSTLIATGDLQSNLLISLVRLAYGFLAGALAGLVFGAGMGFSDGFARFVRPSFLIVSQIPALAWLPFLMLLLGIGESLKIVLVAKSVFVPVALSTAAAIRAVPAKWLELARALKLRRWTLLRRVVLPAALPELFGGLRYGLTHAWMALVMVELLAAYEGIGYLMIYSRQLFQLDVMVAIMLVIAGIGLLLDRALALGQVWLARRYGGAS